MNIKKLTFLLSFPLLCSTTAVKAVAEPFNPLLIVGGVIMLALKASEAFLTEGIVENVITHISHQYFFYNNVNTINLGGQCALGVSIATSLAQQTGYDIPVPNIPDVVVKIVNTSLLAANSLVTGGFSAASAVVGGPLLTEAIKPLFLGSSTKLYAIAKPLVCSVATTLFGAAQYLYYRGVMPQKAPTPYNKTPIDQQTELEMRNRVNNIGIYAIQTVIAGLIAKYIVTEGLSSIVEFFTKE